MIAEAHQHHPELSIRSLCQLLQVNRSWYYGPAQEKTGREKETALRDAIEQLILEFPGYGYRRVTKALQRADWQVNHKRVLRIMRQESLLCQLTRHFVITTRTQGEVSSPHLLKQVELIAPDQA